MEKAFRIKQIKIEKREREFLTGEELKRIELELTSEVTITNQKIQRLATEKGWELIKPKPDGSFDELVGILPDGSPLYYSIENVNAAKSTRANHLNTGGSLNLNLNGEGLTVGVWDGGPTRISHQEFGNRMTVGDGVTTLNGNSFHATHVTGTIGAAGIDVAAKGMAPSINVKTFNWTNDILEVVQEAQNGLLLSNHSYGTSVNSITTPWYIGAYSQPSRAWDEIAYAAPYYLMVASDKIKNVPLIELVNHPVGFSHSKSAITISLLTIIQSLFFNFVIIG